MKKQTDQIPHFIIVGAMKSGSSSLMHHLRNHKKIHTPSKELHFFNNDNNYRKGLNWYIKKILEKKNPEAEIFGEKTPSYSYQKNVAERIYQNCPDSKIIWIFRNPVERTYSNYLHSFKQGKDLLCFEDAIKMEEKRIKSNIWYGYKTRSIYHLQVERFLKFFPKEQMFFLLFDDLIKLYSSDHVLNELFGFLGISEEEFTFVKEFRNKTILPRFPSLLFYSRKWGLYNFTIFRRLLKIINFYHKKPGYTKMSLEIREELKNFFKPHNQKLGLLINKNLDKWNK
ncbi:MAG: sulfotransferase family protein [bacterium]